MAENIRETIMVLLNQGTLFGLFPVSRSRTSDYKVSMPRLLFFLLMCSAHSFFYLFFISNGFNISEEYKFILEVDMVCLFLLNSIPIVSTCELIFNLRDLNECFFYLEEVEAELIQLGRRVSYNTMKRPLRMREFLVLLALTSRLIKNTITEPNMIKMTSLKILYLWSLITQLLIVAYWNAGVIRTTTSLFCACKQELALSSTHLVHTKTRKLERLLRSHYGLCQCSALLNRIHCVQLLFLILTSFVIFVFVIYQYILLTKSVFVVLNILPMFVKIAMAIVYSSVCFQIVQECMKCVNEAKAFSSTLYQIMLQDKTNELSNNLKLKLHIIMKSDVIFTACGFFKLDYTLIHSMIAAATTYLVLLIQFSHHSRDVRKP